MPQSLSKVILHIIFSTKNREPWLDRDMRSRMHAYLATICRDLGAELACVGGAADHYVEVQQEHHRTRTSQDEYRKLLRKHGVDFDERYIWD